MERLYSILPILIILLIYIITIVVMTLLHFKRQKLIDKKYEEIERERGVKDENSK